MESVGRYSFPRLEVIVLRDFSLFSKNGIAHEINESINDGVYCLAGANGIGKTSFLTAINFGLTGIVLEPYKEIFSPKEILKNNKRYTEDYFDGRIHARHEKTAEIEITFKINDKFYKITRGFFEWQELRKLEIYKETNGKKIPQVLTSTLSPGDMNNKYKEQLAKEVGLESFEDFIFLQLYIFTFDEHRRGIFWDKRGSQIALSMAFYSDKNDAERLVELRRQWEKYDSNGRNKRWEATQVEKKIEALKNSQDPDNEEVKLEYKDIVKNYDDALKSFENTKAEHDSILRQQSSLNSEIMRLRKEHKQVFSLYAEPRNRMLENTDVKMALQNKECFICGSKGESVKNNIEYNIHKEKCPLCNTDIIDEKTTVEPQSLLRKIQDLDRQINSKQEELENLIIEEAEKSRKLKKAEFEFQEIDKMRKKFEDENPTAAIQDKQPIGIHFLMKEYGEQFNKLVEESKREYRKRDELKPEYDKLQGRLRREYLDAEKYFVPVFQSLAKSFIGLDLYIQVEIKSKLVMFSLTLKNTLRTGAHQLSESQRYFLDIALRMSLAIYMSKQNQEVAMFIDTPEGSLDIAYESRAGKMFADFVKKNHPLVMTANINASQLLIALAKECGEDKMHLRRMLEWTDLSEVQKDGEKLFETAFQNIEKAQKEANP